MPTHDAPKPPKRPRRQPLREVAANARNHPHATPHPIPLSKNHKKAVVAAKYYHPELTYTQIGEQKDLRQLRGQPIPSSTVHRTWTNAVERAGGKENLPKLLEAAERKQGSGRPKKLVVNKPLSRQLYNKIHESKENEDMPYRIIWQQLPDLQSHCGFSTMQKHAYDDLRQRQRLKEAKPQLSKENRELREEYAEWGLQKLREDAVFIFTDETKVSLYGRGWNKVRATLDEGEDIYKHVSKQPPWKDECFIVWAAICEEWPVKYYIWEEPSPQEILRNDEKHEEYVAEYKNKQKYDQEQAKIQGAWQEKHYKAAIEAAFVRQEEARKQGKDSKKRKIAVREVFTKDYYDRPPQRRKGTKGIDYIRYMQQVQLPILYLFAEEVQKANPNRQVYIVEDNASCHVGARRMTEGYRVERGLEVAPHPPNSPDLNEIEPFWGDSKGRLPPPSAESKTQAMKECKKYISYIFETMPQQVIDRRCQHFKNALSKCKQHRGNNDYHG